MQLFAALLGMSIIIFVAMRVAPGDPAERLVSPLATDEELEQMREALGLNKPIYEQYAIFLNNVLHGHLGKSLFYEQSVLTIVLERLPATLELAVISMLVVIAFGIPLGIYSATHSGSWLEVIIRIMAYIGQAMPSFWLAIVLILVFSVGLGILPSFGRRSLGCFVLPAIALILPRLARVMRFVRSAVLEVMHEDYVRTARAKGLFERSVLYGHTFRNALIPVMTDSWLQFAWLLGGAMVVEVVFAWPGIGALTINAISSRDYPLVEGCVLLLALIFLLVNLLMDLSYTLADPRVRYQ
jgi:ABC-type dipeptide/oligopeptide/nickel transport system permease component